ncbi:methyl-accepting chemotaxis protein [Azospirillum fermentarium]|uniref:methyl-accepting chemotaxis protein n=1 Tax=Azospirillum fermentarium TaxID=1233114 RepID=UPI002227087A|nr:methyl-accepting chemotaxis protein [Azospirillum fermentarium]MCW2245800.1 methyl-accepting chemotaxis protein [Azospirillum fermentarium]
MTIKFVLLLVLSCLGGLLLISDLIGLRALENANEDIKTVYEDRVVPLRDLKVISDAYAVFIVDASHKVRNGNFTWADGAASVARAEADIKSRWTTYLATYLVPEERDLVNRAKPLMAAADAAVARLTGILATRDAAALDRFVKTELYQTIDPLTDIIGALIDLQVRVAGESFAEAQASYATAHAVSLLLLLVGALLAAAGGLMVLTRVVRPIGGLTAVMKRLAQGDFSVVIPHTHHRDEVGDMARTVEVFKASGIENDRLRHDQERQRQAGEAAKRAALAEMADTVERAAHDAVEQVAGHSRRMHEAASTMARSADAVGTNSQSVAAAAQQALHNAQTVAAASEQLAGAIREIGTQVAQAGTVSRRAVETGAHTRTTILSLSETVGRIGDVTRLIQDIASQTNLLALNATIEAARAGEMGKGFAVVATEVKNLASQTAKATEDIAEQIAAIEAVTVDAVQAVQAIAEGIAEMDGIAGSIATAVEEQAAATREISRNVHETAAAAEEVSRRIAEVSREAGATGERAGAVRGTADHMADSVQDLRTTLVRVVRASLDHMDAPRAARG